MDAVSTGDKLAKVRERVAEVVVGLDQVVEVLLIAIISGGHVLIEGLPGLGKTTLAKAFAHSIGGTYKRIQMTPDLLPADVLGVNVYNPFDYTWVLRRGPIFANVVLIDELNRASPKVQSAFLQVMQERQVTIENETLTMERPFIVLATQLPLGELGTYPLTSVQIDRFSYRVELTNPDYETEHMILRGIDEIESREVSQVIEAQEILGLANQAKQVFVDEKVSRYIVDLVQGLRRSPHIRMGPSPRASIWLLKGARVKAMMGDRGYVVPDDVKQLIDYVLPHRVELTAQARADEVSLRSVIDEAVKTTVVPKGIEG